MTIGKESGEIFGAKKEAVAFLPSPKTFVLQAWRKGRVWGRQKVHGKVKKRKRALIISVGKNAVLARRNKYCNSDFPFRKGRELRSNTRPLKKRKESETRPVKRTLSVPLGEIFLSLGKRQNAEGGRSPKKGGAKTEFHRVSLQSSYRPREDCVKGKRKNGHAKRNST